MADVEAPEPVNTDAQRKNEEREKKKAEVRRRLEEEGKAGKKKKKGFLTPERKKKLRKLLMSKAAEDLKRQQLQKEQERQKALASRTIPLPAIDNVEDHGKLETVYNDLFSRLCQLEAEKYDINQAVLTKEHDISELSIAVNDLRGKFVKPTLKKVSKYDNRFKKLAETASKKEDKADFRTNLKTVKKENVFTQIANTKKSEKPDWTKKKDAPTKKEEEKKEDAPAAADEAVSEAEDVSEAAEASEVSEAEE